MGVEHTFDNSCFLWIFSSSNITSLCSLIPHPLFQSSVANILILCSVNVFVTWVCILQPWLIWWALIYVRKQVTAMKMWLFRRQQVHWHWNISMGHLVSELKGMIKNNKPYFLISINVVEGRWMQVLEYKFKYLRQYIWCRGWCGKRKITAEGEDGFSFFRSGYCARRSWPLQTPKYSEGGHSV